MKTKNKTGSWLIIITGTILAILAVCILWPETAVNCIAIVGSFASVVGIAITMSQVSSVKKEVSTIRSIHNVADFKGESTRVRLIQDALPTDEHKFIMWHIGELKSFLVKQKSNPIVKNDNVKANRIEQIIVDLGIDIKNLNGKINDSNQVLNKDLISKHIEDAATLIDEVNGELDNITYDGK